MGEAIKGDKKGHSAAAHAKFGSPLLVSIWFAAAMSFSTLATAQNISTVMGPSGQGCEADTLNGPNGVAVDRVGNIYVSTFDNVVCKLSVDGAVSRFAGYAGLGDFAGDDGQALEAKFNGPTGLTIGPDDNLYIADSFNDRIRVVDVVSGVVTTVAGGSNSGDPAALAPDNPMSAKQALLNRPKSIAFDSKGDLYFADKDNKRVRKLDIATQIISTAAGSGYPDYREELEGKPAGEFNMQPNAIAFDSQDNLLIADDLNGRIYRLPRSNGNIGTIRDKLESPSGMVLDRQGNIYIANGPRHTVSVMDASLQQLSTIAGNGELGFVGDGGAAIDAQFSRISAIAINSKGDLYIADEGNNRIRKIGSSTPVVPQAPKNIATQSGDGQVTVSWDAPVGGAAASGITGYTVTATPEGKECKAGPDETSCVVSGLSNATAYNFVVVANSAAGPSPSASSEQPVTPVASVSVPPEASSLPRAEVGKAYNATIRPTGGTAPYQFRIVAGSLPMGLSAAVSTDGSAILISGTPAQTETAIFSMEIADSTVAFKRNALSKAGPTITTVTLAGSITVAAAGVVPPVGPTGATAVPTLNQWGLMLLSLILAGFAAVRVRPGSRR